LALSGLQIFKLLPKTNCKDCGFPTCMAFALQLAAGKAELSQCPSVTPAAAAELGAAAAPPVRKVTVGAGPLAVTLGEETVLYRHEKRFEHPPGFAILADDSVDDARFQELLDTFKAQEFDRVGQVLRARLIAVESADAGRLAARALKAHEETGAGIVLMSTDATALRAAAEPLAAAKPLLYAADAGTFDAVCAVAKDLGVPFVVKAPTLEELEALGEKCAVAGLNEVVLDTMPATLGDALRDQTFVRRAAIKKRVRGLGFPTIAFPCRMTDDPLLKPVFASVFVEKYAGIIVLDTLDPAQMLPLLVLCQNIYTDPQRPMQMDKGIYPINDPGRDSPVLVTTNFSLTYFTVAGEIEASKVPVWLLVMDSEGMSVLTAWAAGKFVADAIAPFVKACGIQEKVDHRTIMIPGYVAQISGELEQELGDWKVVVGVREAADLPRYLRAFNVKTA
jgi:acetyl-CoA decarbonylase/synthase, CODH/ACS complex subunit gamma